MHSHRAPSECVLSGIWDIFKDGGYCVAAAKVMKRANIQYKVEAAVLYGIVKGKHVYVLQNISWPKKLLGESWK